MLRTIAILPTLLLSVCAASAAPKPKDDGKPVLYYPTRVGTKWVYDDGRETTLEISAVEVKGDVTIVTVDSIGGKGKELYEKMEVSAKGVQRLQFRSYAPDPNWRLKLPAKVGDSWTFDYSRQAGVRGEKGTNTIGETETVEVPAGKFRAIRVESSMTEINGAALPDPIHHTSWYAPGVGLVKMTGPNSWTRALKSFTEGK